MSYLERGKCERALVLQREGRVCATECVARGGGFAGVHEWFDGVWRGMNVRFKIEEFMKGKERLVKMKIQFIYSYYT